MNRVMKKSILASLLLGLGLFSTPATTFATLPIAIDGQTMPSLAPMIEKVRPAVVSIAVEGKTQAGKTQYRRDIPEEFEFFFGPDMFGERSAPRNFRGQGSGAIINAEKGYVITNNHVIKDADKITIKLEDGREFKAKLVGADPLSDVALVQMENPKDLIELKFADSDKLRVGDFSVAIGNPFGLGQTVTSGIISALGRSTGSIDEGYESYIQTDAAVNQGNSGGPLINLNGELIGINTAIISPSGGNAGIAFAIPSNMANSLVQQIIEFGEVKRGMLGIKGGELNADLAKEFNISAQQGAFISEVFADSAAAKAGLKAGDVITEINGQKIRSFSELRAKVATSGVGKEIELTYLRDGKAEKAKVTLQAEQGKSVSATTKDILPGLKGAELTNFDKDRVKGVAIAKVEKGSLAEQRGLVEGDVIVGVNRIAVENLMQLRQVLDSKPSVVALNILRNGANFYLILQ
ncbi:DegQ family serine endoprotease [Actinobacillus pleuropneumoniae]|uniref:DegQ family serine endoprotease n=1 Tax=Actinobacillus pleuropneumoniae TaxID=715 RepID=UPI001F1979D0|nr:DegQ family serine endoprotease [Actinobacillus pleuropneumoniae]UKH20426.1 DegQ family serine endoprotease [Actinobacillus pleuropneumoniae]UPA20157.1 DegQ family serine endoprotease [Actinobacillus pleuropneumoniae]